MRDTDQPWFAHVTVAAVVEKDGRFLMVHEQSDGQHVYNQPAGHLEKNETLLQACVRETQEETGWQVKPLNLLGISQYLAPANGVTYLRHTFLAEPIKNLHTELDSDIIEAVWLSYDEIKALGPSLRSPLVLNDLKRYKNNVRISLEALDSF